MLFSRIEALCEKHGVTIASLERSVGLGNGTIRLWVESSPKVKSLKAVADYFGVTIDELMKDDA